MSCVAILTAILAAPPVTSDHFKVDQFGYRPAATKVAVISDPIAGFNAPDPYSPAATLEVRNWNSDAVVWSGAPQPWRGGATHGQSGDRAWWLDFTALGVSGLYYIYDPVADIGSGGFVIAEDVYFAPLREAVRSFYYQRCGTPKAVPFAESAWSDSACHRGTEQDSDCRAVLTPTPATSRDLSGGWHDAGDYNKYINFADGPVHDLLFAYQQAPGVWGDDYGLPESDNCVPDILDEVKWELDWMRRMQLPDGSVLHKVSVTTFNAGSPPSTDANPRRYAPATASATISACGAFAHGAVAFGALADPAMQLYADNLETAAVAAWTWLTANPGSIPSSYNNAGFANVSAEEGAYEQDANRVCAAVYLYARTADPIYRAWVDANYTNVHLLQWGFAYPFEGEYQDCLLYYTELPGATPAVASDIRAAYSGSLSGGDHLDHVRNVDDAYRAYLADGDYTWGSNRTKAHQGLMYLNMPRLGLDPANAALYGDAVGGYLHYLHGVNPLGLVFLSNMARAGAERSVDQFYHGWFGDGTDWDSVASSLHGPAPGFVPGGPNPSFAPDPAYVGPPLEPPQNQPIQKSYRDWNTSWPENSWEVTENSITYQAAYVRLLGALAGPDAGATVSDPPSQTVCEGDTARIAVVATPATPVPTFAWRRNGAALVDDARITGTATTELTVRSFTATDAGDYDVVVAFSCSVVVSAAATLTANIVPGSPGNTLTGVKRVPDLVRLEWGPGAGALDYEIARCDASGGRCTPMSYLLTPALNAQVFAAPATSYFYQVLAANDCGTTQYH